MNLKKFVSLLMCLIFFVCLFTGCVDKVEKKETENSVKLDEEIIGCWKSMHDENYYMYFDEDEVYMVSFTSGSEGSCTYEIKDDSIIFYTEGGSSSLDNVLIKDDAMTYTTSDGMEIKWVRINEEELLNKLENY